MKASIHISIIAGALLVVGLLLIMVASQQIPAQGSVMQGSDYLSTTTSQGRFSTDPHVLKTGFGSVAQVTITGAAAGTINLYDATTTDVNKRTGNTSTSSIYVAIIPDSAATGTYTFDARFNNGLILDIDGTIPTSTVTWR